MSLKQTAELAVARGDIPHCIAAYSVNGQRREEFSVGVSPSAGMRLMSQTKAVTSLACVQLIEKGLLSPETPIDAVLPELHGLMVLTGFEGETPILRPPNRMPRVKDLLTHTSGYVYDTACVLTGINYSVGLTLSICPSLIPVTRFWTNTCASTTSARLDEKI